MSKTITTVINVIKKRRDEKKVELEMYILLIMAESDLPYTRQGLYERSGGEYPAVMKTLRKLVKDNLVIMVGHANGHKEAFRLTISGSMEVLDILGIRKKVYER